MEKVNGFFYEFTVDDFQVKKFTGLSALGFYWIRIIPVFWLIIAVLGIYHEFGNNLWNVGCAFRLLQNNNKQLQTRLLHQLSK